LNIRETSRVDTAVRESKGQARGGAAV